MKSIFIVCRGKEIICAIANRDKAVEYVIEHRKDIPGLTMWFEEVKIINV